MARRDDHSEKSGRRSTGRPNGKPASLGSPRRDRRALSTVRGGGAIHSGGEAESARALEQALRAPSQLGDWEAGLTHRLHTYPARMHPETARLLLELVVDPDAREPVVLDPFCGGGTVLVEARRLGARARGVDLNPLAVSITRAKVWTAPGSRRRELAELGEKIAADAWTEGKAARRSGYSDRPHRVARGLNARAARERHERIGEWFPPHVRRELEFIAGAIDNVRERDEEFAELLTVCISAVLYKVSRRASDTDPTKVLRNIGRGAAGRHFRQRVEQLCEGLDELSRASRAPMGDARVGDATALERVGVRRGSVSAIVTSPPYAGTYDYADQHQLRLDFLGVDSFGFRANEMGARRAFQGDSVRRTNALRNWERDLAAAIGEMAWALEDGGLACVVMGDSMAGGHAVFADEILNVAAGKKMSVVAWASQERTKFGGAENRAFGDRPKREHVVLLRR